MVWEAELTTGLIVSTSPPFHQSPLLIRSLQLKTKYQQQPPKQHVPGKLPNSSPWCLSLDLQTAF